MKYNIGPLCLAYSLNTMSSRFIHVAACVRISFLLRMNNIPLYEYTMFYLSIHPWMDILLSPLALVNSAAVNTGVQTFVPIAACSSSG